MAKEEFGHSYTFGTMAIMIFSPVSNSLHHPLLITDMPSKCGVRYKDFFFKVGISEWFGDFSTIVYRRLLLQTTATSPYLSWPPPSSRGAAGA